jgi:hypothetical protein
MPQTQGYKMSLDKFADIYRNVGFEVEITAHHLKLSLEDTIFQVPYSKDWVTLIGEYYKSKNLKFDYVRRILSSTQAVEVELVRIDPALYSRPDIAYTDQNENSVRITSASPNFTLSLMHITDDNGPPMIIKRRLLRRSQNRTPETRKLVTLYRFDDILFQPVTAEYTSAKKTNQLSLMDSGLDAIKSSLFKLSLSNGECWELRDAMPKLRSTAPSFHDSSDMSIPKCKYNDDLVKFYKVARSSAFPSQQFLSFYHILEYNFLRVSDEILHTNIKSMVNSPNFNSNYQNINKLIATLKKYDSSSDETEMLKAVLKKYVDEDALIEHIKEIENNAGRLIYTDTKKRIFGELGTIKLEKGHTIQNTSRAIKQIRNALVHSSDKFNREDCFLPLSESETTVTDYVPLLRFLAETVIFATSET